LQINLSLSVLLIFSDEIEERPERRKTLLNPPDPDPKFGCKGHLLDKGVHSG